MKDENASRLQEVFRGVFDLPGGTDVRRLRQMNEPKWDSLAHASLVVAIESEFGIELSTADAMRITSYEASKILLDEHGL